MKNMDGQEIGPNEEVASAAPAEEPSRNFKFGETPAGVALICILAALDCIMARIRVEDSELHTAVVRKFEQAGVPMPAGLVEGQDV